MAAAAAEEEAKSSRDVHLLDVDMREGSNVEAGMMILMKRDGEEGGYEGEEAVEEDAGKYVQSLKVAGVHKVVGHGAVHSPGLETGATMEGRSAFVVQLAPKATACIESLQDVARRFPDAVVGANAFD